MIRLFIDSEFEKNKKILLDIKHTHYLLHVMRLQKDDKISCFNGKDGDWIATFSLEKKKAFILLEEQISEQIYLPKLILCPAIIKKDSMDFVWQKATELGATDVYPIVAERSVLRSINKDHALSIVQEASEQCERNDLLTIHDPVTLEACLKLLSSSAQIVWLSERGKTCGKKSKLPPALFVGPEGGWSQKEQELFKNYNAYEWHYGRTILRAETASLASLAIWSDYCHSN